MTKRQWTISTELSGAERNIDIVVHDNAAQMRSAATRFSKMVGEDIPNGHFRNALAVTHCYYTYDPEVGEDALLPDVATLRFVRGHMSMEILSHEVAHLAQWLYRADVIGEDSTDTALMHFHGANEEFCHMLSALLVAVLAAVEEEL